MPTIQIWATNQDMEDLRRLKEFFKHAQNEELGGRHYITIAGRRRKIIKRDKINDAYIYREALKLFWLENEKYVREFEKRYR